jgi:Ca2+/Na+ antiporter
LKAINFLFLAAFILIAAVVKYPSLAVSMPLCFTLIALVVIFYLENREEKQIKSVEKRISQIESDYKSLKSSMSLKNL